MEKVLLKSASDIKRQFPLIPVAEIARIEEFNKRFRFGISQEMLDYLEKDPQGVPLESDSLARLYWPFPNLLTVASPDAYNLNWDNWEMPSDFPIPGNWAWQWKYSDRICHRTFGCEEMCLHCFETIRVLDKKSPKKARSQDWQEGIEFVRTHPEINEVIFTGGEPLVAPDSLLERRFAEIRSIPHIRTIRIHTAKGVHNTDRLSDSFGQLCKRFAVTEIAFHIVHPRQVTPRFCAAMERLSRGCGSVIRLAHIPILRGVNDNTDVLKELCTRLVMAGVRPYYFLHSMPSTLGAKSWRLPVSRMADVVRPIIGRGFSHVQCAEPIIVARGGKKTIPVGRTRFWLHRSQVQERVWAVDNSHQPLEIFARNRQNNLFEFDGTPDFMYATYLSQPVVIFKNWKGGWEMYPDS